MAVPAAAPAQAHAQYMIYAISHAAYTYTFLHPSCWVVQGKALYRLTQLRCLFVTPGLKIQMAPASTSQSHMRRIKSDVALHELQKMSHADNLNVMRRRQP